MSLRCTSPRAFAPDTLLRRLAWAGAMVTACAWPLFAQAAGPASASASAGPLATAACPALLRHQFARLQDEKLQDLCQYRGKVLLIVNTASFCGFTPQFRGLEALHSRYKDRGLVVLGFPSNDFAQETGSNTDIADFCENTYGVKFPMFTKSVVRGPDANALFRQLAQHAGRAPGWNFHKYLLGRDGRVIEQYPSRVAPEDANLRRAIEAALG